MGSEITDNSGPELTLTVDFCGEVHSVAPGHDLTFGRDGDLVVDSDNRHLHRLLGRFTMENGLWWLQNLGTGLAIEVLDRSGPSALSVGPGAARPLAMSEGVVRFTAGLTTYEMQFSTVLGRTADSPREIVYSGQSTVQAPVLRLNDEQRLLLAALAEPRLRDPHDSQLPSNKDVRIRLGWSRKKLDGKLDYLCRRLDELGVRGLRGDLGSLATDRRDVLVDHVLATRMITGADLVRLEVQSGDDGHL